MLPDVNGAQEASRRGVEQDRWRHRDRGAGRAAPFPVSCESGGGAGSRGWGRGCRHRGWTCDKVDGRLIEISVQMNRNISAVIDMHWLSEGTNGKCFVRAITALPKR